MMMLLRVLMLVRMMMHLKNNDALKQTNSKQISKQDELKQ